MMITGTIDIVVVMAASVVAAMVLRPYVPSWMWFMIAIGLMMYSLIHILADGWTMPNVAGLVLFSLFAVNIWWRDLRGTGCGGWRR